MTLPLFGFPSMRLILQYYYTFWSLITLAFHCQPCWLSSNHILLLSLLVLAYTSAWSNFILLLLAHVQSCYSLAHVHSILLFSLQYHATCLHCTTRRSPLPLRKGLQSAIYFLFSAAALIIWPVVGSLSLRHFVLVNAMPLVAIHTWVRIATVPLRRGLRYASS